MSLRSGTDRSRATPIPPGWRTSGTSTRTAWSGPHQTAATSAGPSSVLQTPSTSIATTTSVPYGRRGSSTCRATPTGAVCAVDRDRLRTPCHADLHLPGQVRDRSPGNGSAPTERARADARRWVPCLCDTTALRRVPGGFGDLRQLPPPPAAQARRLSRRPALMPARLACQRSRTVLRSSAPPALSRGVPAIRAVTIIAYRTVPTRMPSIPVPTARS